MLWKRFGKNKGRKMIDITRTRYIIRRKTDGYILCYKDTWEYEFIDPNNLGNKQYKGYKNLNMATSNLEALMKKSIIFPSPSDCEIVKIGESIKEIE